jgi:Mannosyltransferase (PIG-V)
MTEDQSQNQTSDEPASESPSIVEPNSEAAAAPVGPRDRFQAFLASLDWDVIGTIVLIKLLLFLFAARSFQIVEGATAAEAGGTLEIWNRWDSLNYLKLAQYGYVGSGEMRALLVFYPLYPWLVRFLTELTSNYLISALLISTIASIAAGLLLKKLILLDHSEETARRAVWFLFIFPTSYFLHIGYTESLFLALALGGFISARTKRWWLAGVLSALACMTRGTGLVLLPALAFEAFAEFRASHRWNWSWLWIPIALLGFGCYLLINRHAAGNAFAFISIRRQYFYISSSWLWVGILDVLRNFSREPGESELLGTQELLFIVIGAASAFASFALLRASYTVWIAGNWLLVTSVTFVASVPRYTLVMFPIFILFAKLAKRPLWNVAITVWSLLNLGLFVTQFVRGRWAF